MSEQLRNGGCLTSFPASLSTSPFPSDTLPSTDWTVCVASCYCRVSSETFTHTLPPWKIICLFSHQPVHLCWRRCRGRSTERGSLSRAISHGARCDQAFTWGVKQWKLYLIEVHKGISWHSFKITTHKDAGVTGRAERSSENLTQIFLLCAYVSISDCWCLQITLNSKCYFFFPFWITSPCYQDLT